MTRRYSFSIYDRCQAWHPSDSGPLGTTDHRSRLHLPLAAILFALVVAGCQRGSPGPPIPTRIVDLSPPLTRDFALHQIGRRALDFLGTDGRTTVLPVRPPRTELAFGLDQITLLSHSGSHLDAPARILRGGASPAEIRLEQLIGPVALVDLRWHDRKLPLQITDLEQTKISAGDAVILFTGYEPPAENAWPGFAGLSAQASQWLAAKRVRVVATDMPALLGYEIISKRLSQGSDPDRAWAEYVPLFQAQISIIAGLVHLAEIAEETRVMFVGLPLPLTSARGAPVRAAAFVY